MNGRTDSPMRPSARGGSYLTGGPLGRAQSMASPCASYRPSRRRRHDAVLLTNDCSSDASRFAATETRDGGSLCTVTMSSADGP
ncbi:unnamed protein product [Spirodela intermedia]|uniref:Uncharacterized protein n=1 Tax=Spirodela intermedia TaxID=51605 RepID=A0A7I8J7L2_SPIIN|nr:unnamed protein product [Spirodela intermedia]CAA6666064.1 unnamed protein product [Spirodela intermedia]